MAVKNFSAGAVLTASDTNTYLANSGLVYVASKTWTSTGAGQQINDCFTSTYDNYRIVFAGVGSQTTGQALFFRLVNGITPDTVSTYYSSQNYVTNVSGPSMYWSGATAQINIGWLADINAITTLDIASPQLAIATTMNCQSTAFGTGNTVNGNSFCLKLDTTQYEGLYMVPTTGTWAGTITVYGYRKA